MNKEETRMFETLKITKTQYMILCFFIYAFIGWVLETFYALYALGTFTKRGFLFGPICPLYGYGAIILILFLTNYKGHDIKLFVMAAVIFSIFEYVSGFALDAFFQAKWWDYSNDFFNLNGRISMFFSFVWGIIAIFFVDHIHPYVDKKLNLLLRKFPHFLQVILIYSMAFVYIVDTVLSVLHYVL